MIPETFAALAEEVLAAPPRLARTRLVCVDGPAGSGKTTFAGRLADAIGPDAVLLHMDDLYAGWTLTGAVDRLTDGVLRPLADGRPGTYHRFDWAAGAFLPDAEAVPTAPVLVVEGCASSSRAVDPWASLRIWVEAPEALRLSRGLARDGVALEDHWRRWQEEEAAVFAEEDTRARADLRIDGAAAGDRTGFVVLP
ncbi:MAG: Uridine kinase [Blastococcus sp.]|nr:Uridine kinase [Blastococcus sp.]